ncbi:TonB-dependent receptor domain-containing protein [Pelagibacterium lentulum]|uniref:Ligand-gated channel n=1 Tax=Pelagibacterium lentulum TaxID=2029865 RepID=A0A916VUX0_9HYPH|nr:TonB-dependent receptor [Pelagibacterium lentulum]GGA39032.1 ligand-gated channel [Pelagibacterium lentulum]
MQVPAGATGKNFPHTPRTDSGSLSQYVLRGLLLAGVAYGAMAGVALAQGADDSALCADPSDLSQATFCDIAAGTTLLDALTVISRTGESPIESMASVSRIDAQTLAQRMPATANDIFFGTPGIAIQTDARRAGSAANIRGLQDFGRVQVIVDGARQNFQRSGHGTSSMFFVDPNLLESVEVVRGPVANTYGSGAIGGVVMFNTKSANTFLLPDEDYALTTTAVYDSNARGITTSATGAVRLSENADILANVVWRDFGDYTGGDGNDVVGTSFDVLSGLVKGTIRPTDFSELTLAWNGSRNSWEEGSGARQADALQNTFSVQYEFDDPDNDWLDLHINASVNLVDLTATNLTDLRRWSEAAGTFVTVPAGSETGYDLATYGFDIWNTSRLTTGVVEHELTYGGDIVFDDVTTANPLGGDDSYTPSGQRTVGGAYIQNKMTYDWLEVVGAVRYDVFNLESDAGSSSGSRLSPRLTVGVSPFDDGPLEGLQFYGTYAEGYRSPAITETLINGMHPAGVVFPFLPNPDLAPETAKTWEFGVNYAADSLFTHNDSLRLKAAYFDNAIDNYIGMNSSIPTGTAGCAAPGPGPIFGPGFPPTVIGYYPGTCAQYQNFASAEIRGFELEALYDQQTWFAGLSASIIEGHRIEGGIKSPLVSIPTTQVTGQAGVRLLEGALTVGGEVQRNWAPEGVTMDDYTLVNLFASYQAADNVELNLRVDNLFDVSYAKPLNVGTTSTVYEPGISFKLGATVRW